MKEAVISLSIALSLLLVYATWISVKYYNFEPIVVSVSDTLRIHSVDTIKVEKDSIRYRTRIVETIDTIYIRDTVLAVNKYEYSDSIARIEYSGIDCSIDSIEYHIPVDTVIVTTDNWYEKPERKLSFGLSVGPVIGYGAGIDPNKQIIGTPFIGVALCVGLNYKIK